MAEFLIKELKNSDILSELNCIGFDKSYLSRAAAKYRYKNLKIFGLKAAQANILKQTALSFGADCATPKETITGRIESADCILGGSVSELSKIAVQLGLQPFGLRKLGREIERVLNIDVSENKTKIMGILNLTDNSFSDGGLYNDYDAAVRHFCELIDDGADMIDIGAESTKPYSSPVSPSEQLDRLLPILEFAKDNECEIPISVDTRSAEVAKECLEWGATAINDVSGLTYDEDMVKIVADFNCPVVIQHTKGIPENMQDNPTYTNLIDEIFTDLHEKIKFALENGVSRENIIVDPGIGFGKTREHNFEIIKRIEEFHTLECPILLGISRKSLLNMPEADNFTKDIFTLALNALAIERKVDIIRVHNVKLHRQLLEMF